MNLGSSIVVRNNTRGTSLGHQIQVADSAVSRFLGLLGKRSLSNGRGLLIQPSQGVHTLGMLFPIDVLFLDRNFRVVGIKENLKPYRMTSLNFRAASVLELPVESIRTSLTELNDQLEVAPSNGATDGTGASGSDH